MSGELRCADMTLTGKRCSGTVTHLDKSGFVYCTDCGLRRGETEPCRKLRPAEIKKLTRGEVLTRY